jgi:hypothetical protein
MTERPETPRLTRRADDAWRIVLGWEKTEFGWRDLMEGLRTREGLTPGNARVRTWRVLRELKRVGLVAPIPGPRGRYRITSAGRWWIPEMVVRETGVAIARRSATSQEVPLGGRIPSQSEAWIAWRGSPPREVAFLPQELSNLAARKAHPLVRPPFDRLPLTPQEVRDFRSVCAEMDRLNRRRPELGQYFLRRVLRTLIEVSPAVVIAYPVTLRPNPKASGWVLQPRWAGRIGSLSETDDLGIASAWEVVERALGEGKSPGRNPLVRRYLRAVRASRPKRGLAT